MKIKPGICSKCSKKVSENKWYCDPCLVKRKAELAAAEMHKTLQPEYNIEYRRPFEYPK